jgi:hypothetical protein
MPVLFRFNCNNTTALSTILFNSVTLLYDNHNWYR